MHISSEFLGGVAFALVVVALVIVVSRIRFLRRMIKAGYWVFVTAPTFEKSVPYRVIETTPTQLLVSQDGLGLSARWCYRSQARPASRLDPYKKIV